MTVRQQVERLIDVGLPALTGQTPAQLRRSAADLPELDSALLVVHRALVPAADLAPLLRRNGKEGFVVVDLADLAEFAPRPELDVPDRPLYLALDPSRGDDLRDVSPDDGLPLITEQGRSPMTLHEGISWLLQDPDRLEPNHCFMTIGTRKPKNGKGFDARTPALWISGGTGRDGTERRGAPKLGWCWAGNRHTWLGLASVAGRRG